MERYNRRWEKSFDWKKEVEFQKKVDKDTVVVGSDAVFDADYGNKEKQRQKKQKYNFRNKNNRRMKMF